MTLAKSLFVTLAFHAKNHHLLTRDETLERITRHVQQGIVRAEEKIAHTHSTSPERQSLKQLVHDLRQEFDSMKES